MGKAKKEHRAKVAKRNQRIASEKTKMQKAFNKLLQEQMEKFKEAEEDDGLKVQMGDSPIEFNVIDVDDLVVNEVENVIDVETTDEVTTIKETLISEEEEQ
jgi:hypothetical protein